MVNESPHWPRTQISDHKYTKHIFLLISPHLLHCRLSYILLFPDIHMKHATTSLFSPLLSHNLTFANDNQIKRQRVHWCRGKSGWESKRGSQSESGEEREITKKEKNDAMLECDKIMRVLGGLITHFAYLCICYLWFRAFGMLHLQNCGLFVQSWIICASAHLSCTVEIHLQTWCGSWFYAKSRMPLAFWLLQMISTKWIIPKTLITKNTNTCKYTLFQFSCQNLCICVKGTWKSWSPRDHANHEHNFIHDI